MDDFVVVVVDKDANEEWGWLRLCCFGCGWRVITWWARRRSWYAWRGQREGETRKSQRCRSCGRCPTSEAGCKFVTFVKVVRFSWFVFSSSFCQKKNHVLGFVKKQHDLSQPELLFHIYHAPFSAFTHQCIQPHINNKPKIGPNRCFRFALLSLSLSSLLRLPELISDKRWQNIEKVYILVWEGVKKKVFFRNIS